MSDQIKTLLTPLFAEYTKIKDFEMNESKVDNTLVVSLPSNLIRVIRKNPKKFYALAEKLKCESLHFVSFDTGVIKGQNGLKVSKNYLKELARDIVYPTLVHGYYTETSDMGKNEIYHVLVDSQNEEKLKAISKVYTEITGMKSRFLVSNRTDNIN